MTNSAPSSPSAAISQTCTLLSSEADGSYPLNCQKHTCPICDELDFEPFFGRPPIFSNPFEFSFDRRAHRGCTEMVAQHGGGEAHLMPKPQPHEACQHRLNSRPKLFSFVSSSSLRTFLCYHCLNNMLPGFGFSVGDFISAIGEC